MVQAIKDEIATSCPKVVTDGSRVFRVRWIDYEHDHVKVLVDCRLRNPPTGETYYKARQGVLEAIARAVQKEGMNFALPREGGIKPMVEPLQAVIAQHPSLFKSAMLGGDVVRL